MSGVADPTSVWRHGEHVFSRSTPRSAVVLPRTTDDPFVLQGAAAAVWEALVEPGTDEQLVDRVAARFGVSCDDVRAVVVATRGELDVRGVIVAT